MINSAPVKPGDILVRKPTNKVHTVISVDFGHYLTVDTGESFPKSEFRTPEKALDDLHHLRMSLVGQLENLRKDPLSQEEITHRHTINTAHINRQPLFWKKRYPYPPNAINEWEELPDYYQDKPLDWELYCYMLQTSDKAIPLSEEEMDIIVILKNTETGCIRPIFAADLGPDTIDPSCHKILSMWNKTWI